jgi:hypothetical protein
MEVAKKGWSTKEPSINYHIFWKCKKINVFPSCNPLRLLTYRPASVFLVNQVLVVKVLDLSSKVGRELHGIEPEERVVLVRTACARAGEHAHTLGSELRPRGGRRVEAACFSEAK